MLPLLALLALGAAPQRPLENTTWTLTSLSFGAGTITPGPVLTRPSLRFQGGAVVGHTGCSPLKASVQVRGQALLFRDINAGSADFCPDHALGLREDFTALLARATRYSVRDGQLTVYAGKGRLDFTAQSAGSAAGPLRLRGRYVLKLINGKQAPRTSEPVTLNIEQDSLSGSDGCNDYGSTYELRGSQIVLTGLASNTARGCLTAPGVELLGLLGQRPSVARIGQTLTLRVDGREWIFTAR